MKKLLFLLMFSSLGFAETRLPSATETYKKTEKNRALVERGIFKVHMDRIIKDISATSSLGNTEVFYVFGEEMKESRTLKKFCKEISESGYYVRLYFSQSKGAYAIYINWNLEAEDFESICKVE